jgi:DNA (cytosine-5)-methyltransferase 1
VVILDLFCGAGGAAMGYHRAGFEVIGVDIAPQPHFPFVFYQWDALAWMEAWLGLPQKRRARVDAIHASPPCQAWTHARHLSNRGRGDHPRLISAMRDLLESSGLPFVIENVEDAKPELLDPVRICGSSVGLVDIQRHRLFEANFPLSTPPCAHHLRGPARFPGTPRADGSRPLSTIVNQMASGVSHSMLAEAMGIDFMPAPGRRRPSKELCEAIPPAYTLLIGQQLRAHLERAA